MNRFLIFLTTYWSFMADNKYDKKKITHKYLIENIFQEIHVHVLQHFCIYFTLKVAAASSLLPTAMMSHPAMLTIDLSLRDAGTLIGVTLYSGNASTTA